jgi:hypothetical protein
MKPHFIFIHWPTKKQQNRSQNFSTIKKTKQNQNESITSQTESRTSQTHLHRTKTWTLTPFSLSYLLWLFEFESADRRSRTALSDERGVCDGDNGTNPPAPPPLLCWTSISLPS